LRPIDGFVRRPPGPGHRSGGSRSASAGAPPLARPRPVGGAQVDLLEDRRPRSVAAPRNWRRYGALGVSETIRMSSSRGRSSQAADAGAQSGPVQPRSRRPSPSGSPVECNAFARLARDRQSDAAPVFRDCVGTRLILPSARFRISPVADIPRFWRGGERARTAFPTSFDPRPDCCIVRRHGNRGVDRRKPLGGTRNPISSPPVGSGRQEGASFVLVMFPPGSAARVRPRGAGGFPVGVQSSPASAVCCAALSRHAALHSGQYTPAVSGHARCGTNCRVETTAHQPFI
jgi:hypothetical protein